MPSTNQNSAVHGGSIKTLIREMEIVSDIQVRIHRAGLSTLVTIEVLNVEYNDEEQITGLHLGPAIVKETVEILDGYTYFREGEPVALTREELAKIAKVVIRANQSLSPVDVC